MKPSELIGKSHLDFVFSQEREKETEFERSITSNKLPIRNLVTTGIDNKGNILYHESNGKPRFNEKGEFIGYSGITRDITDRKKAEKAVQHEKDRLMAVVKSIPDEVWFADKNRNFTLANPSAVKEFALKSKQTGVESLAESLEVRRPDGSLRPVDEAPALRALKGEVVKNEVEIVRTPVSGELKYRQISSAPVRDSNDNIVGSVSVVRDITEGKKAQEALRQSEERFRSVFDKSALGIVIADTKGHVVEGNFAFEHILGYSKGELKGRVFSDFTYPDDAKTEWGLIQEVLDGKRPCYEINKRFMRKDGKTIWVHLTGSVIYDKNRKPAVVIATIEDITERKRAEEKLEEYTENLEKIVEEKTKQLRDSERLAAIGQTAGMVGHDIRNPLHAMSGDVYLTKLDVASLPDSQAKKDMLENLNAIENNIYYINKIVADLQDYSRTLKPNKTMVDIEALIEKALQPKFIPDGFQATYSIDKNARIVYADIDMLSRILSNLGMNAIQSMPDGGKITISVSRGQNSSIISIQDTGVGIPEEVKPKLFTPMFTTKSKGQGFGLAVVKRMTEALGGSISFESEVGKGTKFIVRLPTKEVNGKLVP